MAEDKNFKEFENLPEGWKWVRLGDIVKFVKHIAPKESKPYLEIGDIDINTKKYTIKEKASPNHCIKSKKGNIVISKVRPTRGAISVIIEHSLYVSPAFLVLEFHNSKFLFYTLSRQQFFNYLGTLETGTTYPSVNDEDVLSYKLNLPPLPEQQKIAEIIETIDNAIEKTDKIIEKYKRIKQGLMQDLLTKGIDENGNIRNEKTHKFKDSPLGRIPEEWEVVKLGEVAQIRNEKIVPPKDNKYIGLENIEKETANLNGFIPTDEIEGISNVFKAGDILFGKLRPNLKKFWYAKSDGYCSTELLVIFPLNPKIISEFLYLIIKSEGFLKIAESKVFGTKMPRTSWEILGNYSFPFPPLPEQQRIAEILSQLDQTIEKEEQYKEKLERIKQGLMEDLLTGKVRVNHLIKEGVKNVSTS